MQKKVKGKTSVGATTLKLGPKDYALIVRSNGREEIYLPDKKSYPARDMWRVHKGVIHLLVTTSHVLGILEADICASPKKD